MVAFLQKSTGSEEFHQIIATVETVNNGEQQLSVIVDGQTISSTEASVRRHLQLADADGISSLPNTKIFEQLTLMGYVSNDDKLTFQKDVVIIKEMHDRFVKATTTASSLEAEHGSDKVTSLEDELASTKAIYNKSPITLTKRVKKLEKRLKHKRRRTVIDSLEDEGPRKSHDTAEHRMESEHDDDDKTLAETLLNIKRSAAKGKAIMQESEPLKKIKKKEMIQISLDEEFAKSFYEEEQAQILQDEIYAKQVEAQWIDDEERIPQEAKQTNEKEKKNMCTYLKNQGGYKMSHFKGMSYEDIRPIFERVWDQNQAFVPKDSEIEKEVMKRPGFDLQQESSKKTGGSRKKTLARKRAGEKQSKEGAKRQKTEYEKEKEELKA
ncbi:hypothetical protein Tco_0585889 [Tanacetum coccineum]